MKKVLVAMSGGVDSSVAALKLKENGFHCVGITAIMHKEKNETKNQEEYVKRAKDVCEKLNIKHIVLDFSKDFKKSVIDYFINSYETGKTPNPCVMCNKIFKFGRILDFALNENFDYIATGHYAKIEYFQKENRWLLKKSKNVDKDQSYFLYFLNQHQLSKTLFPLEDMDKQHVKQIAKENDFKAASIKESQDICFVAGKKYNNFIKNNSLKKQLPGNFVDIFGNVLGEHKGIVNYTIGQRKGIGISFKHPMFVKKIDAVKNEIILSEESQLYEDVLYIKNTNLIFFEKLEKPFICKAKIRYHQKEADVVLKQQDENTFKVEFKVKQRAIAKGQIAVFYYKDYVLGGGEIV